MAKKVEVDIEVKTNADEAEGKVKSLKVQLREARVAFENLQNSGKATAASLKEAADKVDDLGDKIDRAKFGAQDFTDKVASLPGPLGALGSGLKAAKDSVDTFGKTLTVSLGIVGLLVTAFFAIKAALGKTKEGQEGLSKATTALNKVLAPFFAILEKVGNAVLPIITKGFEVLGEVMAKVAGFFGVSSDKITEVTASLEENNEAANKLAEDEKKRLDKAEADKKAGEEKDKARLEKKKANLEAENKLKESALAKDKAIAMQTAFNEEQKIGVEADFAKKTYDLQIQAINDKQKLYSKDSNEYKDLQAQKVTAEAGYITKTGELKTQLQKVYKDNGDAITAFEDKLADDLRKIDEKKAADAKELLFIQLQDQIDVLTAQNDILDNDFQDDLNRLDQKKVLLEKQKNEELNNTALTEAERLKIIKKYAKEEQEVDKAKTATKKAQKEARVQLQLAEADAVKSFGVLLQQLAGKNKGIAIAGILLEQGAAIASIAINAQKNFIKDGGVTSPLAWANLAASIISGLTAVLAAKKGIDDINKVQIPGGDSGASGGGAVAMPAYNSGASASIPQINTAGGANPATQISQTIQNAQQMPVKAYVVSGDITSQQQLDRKANRGATFNLG